MEIVKIWEIPDAIVTFAEMSHTGLTEQLKLRTLGRKSPKLFQNVMLEIFKMLQ